MEKGFATVVGYLLGVLIVFVVFLSGLPSQMFAGRGQYAVMKFKKFSEIT